MQSVRIALSSDAVSDGNCSFPGIQTEKSERQIRKEIYYGSPKRFRYVTAKDSSQTFQPYMEFQVQVS